MGEESSENLSRKASGSENMTCSNHGNLKTIESQSRQKLKILTNGKQLERESNFKNKFSIQDSITNNTNKKHKNVLKERKKNFFIKKVFKLVFRRPG